jgi:hypothetical protein
MGLSEPKETHSVFTPCLCEIGVWFLCKVANGFRCHFLTNSNDEVIVLEDLGERLVWYSVSTDKAFFYLPTFLKIHTHLRLPQNQPQ